MFDTIFGPLWVHILMHIMLYSVLACLLAGLLLTARFPSLSRYHIGLSFVLILAVALGQEGLQLLYQGRLPGADEFLDVGVDLAGELLGILLFWIQAKRVPQWLVKNRSQALFAIEGLNL